MDPTWLTGIGTLVLAVATGVLAGITVWSVRSNNAANRILREENRQLREQERNRMVKVQALEIINNWADEIVRILGDKMFSLQSEGSLNSFLYKIGDVTTDLQSVDTASKLFEHWIQELITTSLSKFTTFRKSIFNLRDSYMKTSETDKEKLKTKLIEDRLEVLNCTFKLQRCVREQRISLLI